MPHDRIKFLANTDDFIFDPVSGGPQKEVLYISRNESNASGIQFSTKVTDSVITAAQGGEEIFGIIGVINLLRGPYLLLITGRKSVARVKDRTIWLMTKYKIIPFSTSHKLSPSQEQDEEQYLAMLNSVLSCGNFYFSHSLDITRRLQSNSTEDNKPLWQGADERFFWNYNLQKPFIQGELHNWVIPIMMGFVQNELASLNGKRFDFLLISRRNWKRAGTRYNVRGIDAQGNVANNVETEQLVIYENQYYSYIVTRGSIPVFWSQKPNLKYKPKPVLTATESESLVACRRHFDEQSKHYGTQVVVNLIDHKPPEISLGNCYENLMKKMDPNQIRYVAFDFHKEVKGMKYEKLGLLLDNLKEDIKKQGYYASDSNGTSNKQTGVCRVNCVDNLDRTNVVQSIIARHVLNHQLITLGILPTGQEFNAHPGFERIFKDLWANNGDAMSFQYSGTGALKADFTRTGKRTKRGLIDDGVNSLKRYYLNNFKDGEKQDSLDLFVGNYTVDPNAPSPFASSERSTMYFFVLFIGILMSLLSLFTPTEFGWTIKFLVLAFWAVASYFAFRTVVYYGSDLANQPSFVTNH
eukprot:TRINITY_DN1546_c0_g1_i1.p1 TRINITY_DN1546_c0_g1~~TRINITY_DN1546_c0_g1_i1.p1  ORF type:complete len:581 (-),score=131.13 TRINITY_DN1546_c0_g1_i1:54-1796(-)